MIRLRTGAAVLAAALSLAGPAHAQSVLAARGLGFPLDPVDARARGLGGLTTGLAEPHFSLINPAAVAGLPAAGLSVTFQGDGIDSESPDATQSFSTSRFPAIQAVFPFGPRFVGSLGYAGVLDQSWSASQVDSVDIAGERREIADTFLSRGGTARFRIGGAYRLLDRVDVGLALDLYSGALRDSTRRTISGLDPDSIGTAYNWQGVGYSAGARWRGNALSVSAAVSGGGDLTAEAQDTTGVSKSYGMPLTADVGASARITQRALAAVSLRWAQWSAVDKALEGTEENARDVMQLSGGLEYDGLRFVGRPLPVRLGGRYAQLPFRFDPDAEFADERAVTGGVGIVFGAGAAALNLSGELGQRGDSSAGLVEDFWRVSLSLALLGR
jgi:hypothetical protein